MQQSKKLLEKLNLKYPIIQAPMAGGYCTPLLVSVACNNGILGSLASGSCKQKQLENEILETKKLTKHPFNVNLFIPQNRNIKLSQAEVMIKKLQQFDPSIQIDPKDVKLEYDNNFDELMETILEQKIQIVSFTFGCLEQNYIEMLKRKNNAYIIGTATNVEEGIYLEQNGVDAIIAQGEQAGGHRGSFLNLKDGIVPQLVDTIDLTKQLVSKLKIPVIAAGGIMNQQDIKIAIDAGAAAVGVGSAFLTTQEAGTPLSMRNAIKNIDENGTTITNCFSGRYARPITNSYTEFMKNDLEQMLPYNIQLGITLKASRQNKPELRAMYAGKKAYQCTQNISAQDLIKNLIQAFN